MLASKLQDAQDMVEASAHLRGLLKKFLYVDEYALKKVETSPSAPPSWQDEERTKAVRKAAERINAKLLLQLNGALERCRDTCEAQPITSVLWAQMTDMVERVADLPQSLQRRHSRLRHQRRRRSVTSAWKMQMKMATTFQEAAWQVCAGMVTWGGPLRGVSACVAAKAAGVTGFLGCLPPASQVICFIAEKQLEKERTCGATCHGALGTRPPSRARNTRRHVRPTRPA